MIKTFFIYRVDDPYHEIVEESLFGGHRKKLDFSYTQEDLKALESLKALTKTWLTYSGFEKEARTKVREGRKSVIPVLLHSQNFRALARDDDFATFISILVDTKLDVSMEKIFGLYTRVMTEISKSFLEKYVNNSYCALETVSPVTGEDRPVWQKRHIRHPYLWICFPIQNGLLESVQRT